MKKRIPTIARVILGLIFLGSGIGGFVSHFAFPPDLPEGLATFVKGLAASSYFLPLLKSTETLCGLMLVSGAFVPLALVVLAPIIINIFLTHLFLLPSGLPLAIIVGALEIYLAFFASPYKEIVRQIFRCPMKEAREAKMGQSH
jgi:putative oxidoreductase